MKDSKYAVLHSKDYLCVFGENNGLWVVHNPHLCSDSDLAFNGYTYEKASGTNAHQAKRTRFTVKEIEVFEVH